MVLRIYDVRLNLAQYTAMRVMYQHHNRHGSEYWTVPGRHWRSYKKLAQLGYCEPSTMLIEYESSPGVQRLSKGYRLSSKGLDSFITDPAEIEKPYLKETT